MNYENDVAPYKKKAKRKRPKKSLHKHVYKPCILEYHGLIFDKAHGFIHSPDLTFGSYCVKCGKIGPPDIERWVHWVPCGYGSKCGRSEYSLEAKKELDPATRTLPTFSIGDIVSAKYVELPKDI